MGRPDGFLIWPREPAHRRAVADRLTDSREIVQPLGGEQLHAQAGRCMDCGIPFCHQGCPLGNRIPDFNARVWQEDPEAAYAILASTNNFPEFTGRICPAPCEAACVLDIDGAAVTIEHIERAIVERAFQSGWVRPERPLRRTGQQVAVVGSGPAGLAVADQLNRAGHHVTLYERDARAGGLLRYGIPDFKLEKWLIDRRLQIMLRSGVQLQCGVEIGRHLSWDELQGTHAAVVLCTGATRPRRLAVPGAHLPGVHLAMDYLTQQNRRLAHEPSAGAPIDARGKRVVILGGGDTGADCLGTALRQGAASVIQVEIMPEPPGERAADNPWPRWPLVRRINSSQEEGGAQRYALLTQRLLGEARLEALELCRVERRGGRFEPVPDTTERWPVDLLLLAMGFLGPETEGLEAAWPGMTGPRGTVAVDPQFSTAAPGVFAAGDAVRGASLVVHAISQGRECARHVDAWLRGARSALPTRGRHLPFG